MEPRTFQDQGSGPQMIRHGPLTLDVANYKLIGEGRTEHLTLLQTRLLTVLMQEPGRVHSNLALSEIEPGSTLTEAALKVRMSRLRSCLARLGCGERYLLSVRNVGYIFDPR